MSGVNQMTLFQTWGASVPQKISQKNNVKKSAGRRKTTPNSSSTAASVKTQKRANDITLPPPVLRNSLWGEFGQGSTVDSNMRDVEEVAADEDDDLMVVAVYEAEKSLQIDGNFGQHSEHTTNVESTCLTQISSSGSTYYKDFPGLDSSSAKVWIYPTNYPIRDYQLKISEAALFQNTLVCLPTGLGKTFIAAVVMYNFYRWYPSGKIVFMAPTKPLVAQQIEACYKVMGIPQTHMAELTGSTQAQQRQELWRSRRIFFLTPQVLVNDLSRDTCPALQVRCVVIDEAHKALGNHAYCQVVRQLGSQTQQFRILALSATPGGDTKSVQQVISNLLISHIELRSEESPDIQAHSHQRSLEKVVVPLGESLAGHQALYLQVLERFTGRLIQNRAMSHRDLRSLTKYQLILAREQFRKNPPPHVTGAQHGALEGDFALCISLYHGYELLLQMGLRSLFLFVQGIMDGTKEMSRARNELQRNATFMDLYQEMEAMFVKPTGPEEPFIYSHPKLQKLEEVVLGHFKTWAESSGTGSGPQEVSTRVMIFSSFRESVQEIAAMLNRHLPLVKVMTFMGQASAGKGVKGFTQKEQLEVVRRFREGGFNTLVSTCVGEEGLDIGEVDLIVCFDAQKSPIRLVQRMGRTGRKRKGRIVVILAEGREERTYNQSQSNKRSVYKSIVGDSHRFHMFPHSPRMLPEGVHPALHKMHITCGQFDHGESSRRLSGGGRGRRSHSLEGHRESLFLPHGLGGHQESVKEDGFLSPSELAHWESTMKLGEDVAPPILRRSRFLSIQEDTPPREEPLSSGPTSELSLWEWRHWQNQPFPTHIVDHSNRCHHFTKVMELIDSLRQEEGESRYELELLPHLHKADVVGLTEEAQQEKSTKGMKQKEGKMTKARTKTASLSHKQRTSCLSSADLDRVELEKEVLTESVSKAETTLVSPWTLIKDRVSSECRTEVTHDLRDHPGPWPLPSTGDQPIMDMDFDCIMLDNESESSEVNSPRDLVSESVNCIAAVEQIDLNQLTSIADREPKSDEDSELEALFYLPKWGNAVPKLQPLRQRLESLRVIQVNVTELLSRSPPALHFDLDSPQFDPGPTPFNTKDRSHTLPVEPLDELLNEGHPFQVNFSLEVDEDFADSASQSPNVDLDVGSPDCESHCEPHQQHSPSSPITVLADSMGRESAIGSPSWDEVFEDDGNDMMDDDMDDKADFETPCHPTQPKAQHSKTSLDESMDLFGDDDAFLQMTIPDIPTPENVSIRTPSPLKAPEREESIGSSKSVTETKMADQVKPSRSHASPVAQQEPAQDIENFDCSQDFFSVNFDLSWEEEEGVSEAAPAPVPSEPSPPRPKKQEAPPPSSGNGPKSSGSSTPPFRFHGKSMSTPLAACPGGKRADTSALASPLTSKSGALFSPILTLGPRRALLPGPSTTPSSSFSFLKRKRQGALQNAWTPKAQAGPPGNGSIEMGHSLSHIYILDPPHPGSSGMCTSDSEEEVITRKRGHHQVNANPLSSPVAMLLSDVDSPVQVTRKSKHVVACISDESQGEVEAMSDDDFQNTSIRQLRVPPPVAVKPSASHGKAKQVVQHHHRGARNFLDEEAVLSEGGEVSSDEEDGEEQNQSLEGFVVSNTQCSQGINDSEMQGVYLKSVRSPAVTGKFKMVYKQNHNMDIFSQVPELDETYAEDSFVVSGSDEEELGEEDEEVPLELIFEDSFVEGRRQYPTRRKALIRNIRAQAGTGSATLDKRAADPQPKPAGKNKHSRIVRLEDSSSEEEVEKCRNSVKAEGVAALCRLTAVQQQNDWVFKAPQQQVPPNGTTRASTASCVVGPRVPSGARSSSVSSVMEPRAPSGTSRTSSASSVRSPREEQQEERCRQRLHQQARLSEELDFEQSESLLSSSKQPQATSSTSSTSSVPHAQSSFCQAATLSEPPASSSSSSGLVSVLVDSRCITACVDVVSSLRQRYAVTAHVCSLDGCDFVVSNRMAVERQSQSELAGMPNRKRLVERVTSLQVLFERVCLIVEKDRTKPGEASRPFQHTRYYDSTLASLVRAGVRLLVSGGPEESAALLAELARLEQRKGQAISVPLEVKGHRQQALLFYQTLPCVSYVNALNMSHSFRSVGQLVNSSIEALQKGACVSRPRAEEIYRCLRYSCDTTLMTTNTPKNGL
ncbi:Fanconi anemia group M protein isoform X1 [Coregonus clupeaformis]|uniref:Fanconi anemia group M protein isoform X1 n=2 Tax=Coregonus clupeaformis TaxID=59861 RepID=UPI001E1C7522|nr:Fanconi anemia group M protein isoform X1 [Coregonus clupeaformis]